MCLGARTMNSVAWIMPHNLSIPSLPTTCRKREVQSFRHHIQSIRMNKWSLRFSNSWNWNSFYLCTISLSVVGNGVVVGRGIHRTITDSHLTYHGWAINNSKCVDSVYGTRKDSLSSLKQPLRVSVAYAISIPSCTWITSTQGYKVALKCSSK